MMRLIFHQQTTCSLVPGSHLKFQKKDQTIGFPGKQDQPKIFHSYHLLPVLDLQAIEQSAWN